MIRARVSIWTLFAVVALSAAMFLAAPQKSFASTGINQEMSFEGKIVNTAGTNITDGTYNMEFKIYSGGTATGGGTLVWTEDYLVGGTGAGVAFSSGTFETNLGSVCSLSGGSCETYTNTGVNWNSYPLYLSMQIGNTSACTVTTTFQSNCSGDGEMSPYILLTSTPYAFNSAELGGLSASSFVQTASANTIQPTTNAVGLTVLQNSAGSPSADIFDVNTANSTGVLQIQGPAANTANVVINAVGAGNNVTINPSGTGTLNLGTVASANTIQIGSTTLASGTQTIDIGNDNTAGGTTNITIGDGSSTTAGTTTIQAKTQANVNVGSTAIAVTTGGESITQSTNSTTAFQVTGNAGNLFNIDTVNNLLSYGSGTIGTLNSWSTNTNNLLDEGTLASQGLRGIQNQTVIINGYLYTVGGTVINTGPVAANTATVQYAQIDGNGAVGTFATTTALPTALSNATVVAYNNYIYVFGGYTGAAAVNTIYSARVNNDGTLGSWTTLTTTLPATWKDMVGIVANGYIFLYGGSYNGTTTSTAYSAPLNPDGSVGSFTAVNAPPTETFDPASATYSNGYIYDIGGDTTTADTSPQATVYYAQVNSNGTLGAWATNTNAIPTAEDLAGATIDNGYMYVFGGINGTTYSTSYFYAPIGVAGSIGTWKTGTGPSALDTEGVNNVNGYIYLTGGRTSSAVAASATVSYTSTNRITLGGALDLIGTQGGTLTGEGGAGGTGSTGGSLTAGNTNLVGTLTVQGVASFVNGVSVLGNLSVGSTEIIKPATNTTTAFEVENNTSVPIIAIDTTNNRVNIGSGSTGDTTGYVLVLDNKSNTGDPTGVAGAMYYNSSTQNFRCYEGGQWENCMGGLLASNTSVGTAVASCTTACTAFATNASIPANYCTPGRVINIKAYGVYNSAAAVTYSLGVYMGTNAAKASDTLIGTASTAVSDGAARTNLGWSLDFSIICDTVGAPGTVNGQGLFRLDTAVGTATWNDMVTAGTTSVTNNAATEIQVFPAYNTNAAGDSMTIEDMYITGN